MCNYRSRPVSHMKKINLNDWIESGRGGRGASFSHKDDPDYMLKFDNLLTDPSSMEEELSAASVAYSLGVSTPEPGEVVTDGKRYGLTFRRIPDKVSYARAIGDNPERLEELAKEFAVQTLKLHAIDADTTRMRNIKDIYRSLISRTTLRIEHNQPGNLASAHLEIYDMRGSLVRQFDIEPSGSTCTIAIPWDFTASNGSKLPRGIYVAKAVLSNKSGKQQTQITKVVRN